MPVLISMVVLVQQHIPLKLESRSSRSGSWTGVTGFCPEGACHPGVPCKARCTTGRLKPMKSLVRRPPSLEAKGRVLEVITNTMAPHSQQKCHVPEVPQNGTEWVLL